MKFISKDSFSKLTLLFFCFVGIPFFVYKMSWSSTIETHTIIELIATILALFIGILSLIRYQALKEPIFLCVGLGFLGTFFLDAYHTLVTSKYFIDSMLSPPEHLIPWSWFASRFFLSIILSLSWFALFNTETIKKRMFLLEWKIILFTVAFTLFCFLFFIFYPLPRAYYPEFIFSRPEEFIPALFFLIAFIGFLREANISKPFIYWMTVSLFANFSTQAFFMAYSSNLFDFNFEVAHLLKVTSYLFVLIGILKDIYTLFVDQKNVIAEKSILQQQFSNIIETSPLGIIVSNSAGKIVITNQTAQDLFGYNKEEMLSLKIESLMPKRFRDHHVGYRKKYNKNSTYRAMGEGMNLFGLSKNGEEFSISVALSSYVLNNEKFIVAAINDLTTHKMLTDQVKESSSILLEQRMAALNLAQDAQDAKLKAEEYAQAVQEESEKTKMIIETASDAFISVDKDGFVLEWNPQAEKIFGWSKKESLGKKLSSLIIPDSFGVDSKERFIKFLNLQNEDFLGKTIERSSLTKSKNKALIEFAVSSMNIKTQKIYNIFLKDISERKEMQHLIKVNEERLNLAVDGAEVGIWDWFDVNKNEEWWSPKFYEILGYKNNEINASLDSFKNLLHVDDREKTFSLLEAHFKNKKPFDTTYRLKTKNGEFRWFNGRGEAIFDDQGEPIRMSGTIIDVHEQMLFQEKLKESEARFKNAVEYSAIGMALVSLEGKWLQVNEALSNIIGYSSEELMKIDFQAITHPDDLDKDLEYVKQVINDEIKTYTMEKRYFHRNGYIVWVNLSVSMVRSIAGEPLYFISQIQDITDKKKAEEDLLRSNQELEQFAYVASHDLQEPVRKIVGFTQLFESTFEGDLNDKSREYMNYIIDGAKRMQALIQDLLQYSRAGSVDLELQQVDLNVICQEAISNLELKIKDETAHLDVEELPTLCVHRSFMVRLFQNLIGNALKYRSKLPPVIEISSKNTGAFWEFSVKDNGLGVEEEFFEKIFIIFQRLHSKEKYEGTGIGLAVCRRMVERHGGKLWIDKSTPNKGSVFKFTLPITN